MNKRNAYMLSQKLGEIVESEMNDGMNWVWIEFIRLRIAIDNVKPLRASINTKRGDGTTTNLHISYETLLEFFYFCGLIGHTNINCDTLADLEEQRIIIDEAYIAPYAAINRGQQRKIG